MTKKEAEKLMIKTELAFIQATIAFEVAQVDLENLTKDLTRKRLEYMLADRAYLEIRAKE